MIAPLGTNELAYQYAIPHAGARQDDAAIQVQPSSASGSYHHPGPITLAGVRQEATNISRAARPMVSAEAVRTIEAASMP